MAAPNLPDFDALTGHETNAKQQRDRFPSFVRPIRSWLGVEFP